MKLKFKKDDVVIVKENTTCGFPSGTLCRIVSVSCDSEGYKSYMIRPLGASSTTTRFHDQNDLRKVKGWDK